MKLSIEDWAPNSKNFAVQQAYKGVLSDVKHIDVWTELTDCGARFISGETYVVYAWAGKNGLVTGACSRTRRLSEAGEDLTYLHFMQSGGEDVGRIWGFVSHDRKEIEPPHTGDPARAPVPDIAVQLRSSWGMLRARTGADGGFIFDGLPAGDYELKLPTTARKVHLDPRACKSEWFYVAKDKPGK